MHIRTKAGREAGKMLGRARDFIENSKVEQYRLKIIPFGRSA